MSKKSRKRKLEGDDQSLVDWEQENFFSDEVRDEMESMWEIPQVFHFLHLTKDVLNIPHLSMYEVERMLLIPRASKQLANIMTSLLSSPLTKAKLRKIPPMPYEFWTNILAHKMKGWFKMYHGKHQDAVKVLETIGVEPEFWNVFPDASLIDGKDFEELSFKQRVWLLKTVCDTVLFTRKTVQEEMAKQPWEDQFETVLGTDRYGARYIYFPQFVETDLRIYRQCLDNNILSTVKPRKPQLEDPNKKVKCENAASARLNRNKKKKARWRQQPTRTSRRTRAEEKRSGNCRAGGDCNMSSLSNEDTNLSGASTCSNNNHINLETMNRKRSRRLSKTSDESTISNDTGCSNVRSSGYNSNTSTDNRSVDEDTTQKMFRGFSNGGEESCNIAVISGILNGLQEEIDARSTDCDGEGSTRAAEESEKLKLTNDVDDALPSEAATAKLRSGVTDSSADKDEAVEKIGDNLSSSSKTDDEKLNEIIGVEGSRLADENCATKLSTVLQMSTASKSDDEKLNETKAGNGNIDLSTDDDVLTEKGWCKAPEDGKGASNERDVTHRGLDGKTVSTYARRDVSVELQNKKIDSESTNSEDASLIEPAENDETDSEDDKDSCLSELRTRLQKEAANDNYDNCSDDNFETGYNLRRSRDAKTELWKKKVKSFNDMLTELSVSDFQLVVDSVESLRDLIASFLPKEEASDSNKSANGAVPPCELKLAKKLTELLDSVKSNETTLKDAMKKARSKLQKEWANFKEGSVEDQDSSGEGGLSSNWWVLGSQGCPLPAPGDATLQTLSHPALSPLGAQSHAGQAEGENEKQGGGRQERGECESERRAEQADETQRGGEIEEGKRCREAEQADESESASKDEEGEQQPRRVLRARGVSSYTEQFYSDEEVDENQLEEWADVEAVYAAPGSQDGTPAAHTPQKVGHGDDWTAEEDSDQDWILPSTRKRKNKRPSANRRLKSFQQKLQNMTADAQNSEPLNAPASASPKSGKDKLKSRETKESPPKKPVIRGASSSSSVSNPRAPSERDPKETVPSAETICKNEPVDSVHSELDIKDEGPVFDSLPGQYESRYSAPPPTNFVMMKTDPSPVNYYVMQQNAPLTGIMQQAPMVQQSAIVSGVMPPVPQGYYVQSAQNYIIHSAQTNYAPPRQASFAPPGPQLMSPQQFIGHPGYMPYMVSAAQPHPGFVTATLPPRHVLAPAMPQPAPVPLPLPVPVPVQSVRAANRPVHSRMPVPRQNMPHQNVPHPNGAVIRSHAPVRGQFPRASGGRTAKNAGSQLRAAASKAQKQRKSAASANSNKNSNASAKANANANASADGGGRKTTSLIVLSDSDDEIEMIITEKTTPERAKTGPRRNEEQQRPTTADAVDDCAETTVAGPKGAISPQIIQRMNQGGISITPVKPAHAQSAQNTQLVVVVNETGSHYALALPNGSKLILTPEQVAQIRASNGGKLIL